MCVYIYIYILIYTHNIYIYIYTDVYIATQVKYVCLVCGTNHEFRLHKADILFVFIMISISIISIILLMKTHIVLVSSFSVFDNLSKRRSLFVNSQVSTYFSSRGGFQVVCWTPGFGVLHRKLRLSSVCLSVELLHTEE